MASPPPIKYTTLACSDVLVARRVLTPEDFHGRGGRQDLGDRCWNEGPGYLLAVKNLIASRVDDHDA